MNRYYMNEAEITGDIVSKGISPNPSEYQDLIDDYLAGGGMIQVIPEGVRTKPEFEIEYESDPRIAVDYPYGSALLGGRKVLKSADLYEGEIVDY